MAKPVAGEGFREDSAAEEALGWEEKWSLYRTEWRAGIPGTGNSLSKDPVREESVGQLWGPGSSPQHLEHGQV